MAVLFRGTNDCDNDIVVGVKVIAAVDVVVLGSPFFGYTRLIWSNDFLKWSVRVVLGMYGTYPVYKFFAFFKKEVLLPKEE